VSHLLLYLPVTIAVFVVIEACRTDDAKRIAKATAKNLAVLTAVLVVASVFVFFINRYA
jgi:hypothetical protein